MNLAIELILLAFLVLMAVRQSKSSARIKNLDLRLTALRRQAEEIERRFQGELQAVNENLVRVASGEVFNPSLILAGKKFIDVSPEDARQLFDDRTMNYLLVFDVRDEGEYGQSHLPGAELVPMSRLESRLEEDDREKDRPLLVYSAEGKRSRKACELLTSNGFLHVYNLAGGINAWRGPVETHTPVQQ